MLLNLGCTPMVMCWRFHIPWHYRQMLFWVSGRICGEEREKTTKKEEGYTKMKQVPLQGTDPTANLAGES
jgi:hypothetical protein